ncbi:MAG: hypothetical protein DI564_03625 [Rhodanobacter denitrificans]|uniref:Uncharacterized protein n=1 Tax=Rhodanobacter denitrificans TaxID=666685 RepID=A0A2W5KMV9_9GAMM|nr:MAG: hypothetical protein DI564_03625 [Rhodanobacter denitrificans]
MSYAAISFQFQVHNDAEVVETAYLCPENLPWGAQLDVTPAQAAIPSGQAVVFQCTLRLDDRIIKPGCSNDQGFRLTAWRVAHDADERWGSCFYWVRPRIRTRLELVRGEWYEKRLSVYGQLSLDTDQPVNLDAQLPLRIRLRIDFEGEGAPPSGWYQAEVQPGGMFSLLLDVGAAPGTKAHLQAWFDRTALLGSSRSGVRDYVHLVAPIVH